ncbi:tRNA glutamyl-Q(34) synthetase GluQRS [Propionicimonas sp.]|uniref:tRNA glutamyl-Q(34) synthetase GluQRS n=1 Tax=Propionicimonas sp. TaxID=1955623 RepID=UPI001849B719|nr:tRNA glutamyl-Q(34) synthetase GluQRS [Propionicimonas sp.]MBU3977179.1 tRNA glutamyl-Q(34) synthetase GluQRS [Actinomycetota bacterium]MBA3021105.1 tRNA glutamyl-Q(34) synthetase GluQRS [Propionicimonas sp.]MBU3985689.1 tRNA glutamyl-Q(34) synthetase GluQRS [Actinomycetota bacterium]MBU4008474.1 tRNA glutamyl-Q(34) synthetase GluQRS [Actinomycetota bacterium]MBU4066376.1 tRNA glutamyl-Q(34) synthetase GluQRS [Actinomycetota bacterium]
MADAGRFAPSPTSELHLGNLRTALLAWLFARSTGAKILLRIEDLDTARVSAAAEVARDQLADLGAIGLDFDPPTLWQSSRLDAYAAAIATLDTYPCYCTRREIAEAASAPHDYGHRPYPGTCLRLSVARRAELAASRPPALRVRAEGAVSTITDVLAGQVSGVVDDFVLVRNDGTPAYNLAVVVDDQFSGVDQVVRGDDLLASAPRQAWLARKLGGTAPSYAHVPLVLNSAGNRLAKRDGAVSLSELAKLGISPAQVLGRLAESLGLADVNEGLTPAALLSRFDPAKLPTTPWVVQPQGW